MRPSQPLAERALLWNAYFPEHDGILLGGEAVAAGFAAARQWHFDRFDPTATPLAQLAKLVEDHNAARAQNDPKLWLLLTMELWLRS